LEYPNGIIYLFDQQLRYAYLPDNVLNKMTTYQTPLTRQGVDGLALVAFVLIIFGGLMVFRDISSKKKDLSIGEEVVEDQKAAKAAEQLSEDDEVGSGREIPVKKIDTSSVVAPYDQFTLTQGPHGYSYGHMAIDIAAGKGVVLKSPIQGYVTALFTDQYGNPTLVIENDIYQVTLLHGKYKVAVGDQIQLGQMVGRESNLGNTTDMLGHSCRGRDCGYHTHLNIFDKRIGTNINPLSLIDK
jgi:murein DD-endopeptidase MepM/ murein hydrolase activator NlpD